jgi:predicted RNase H-like HicB family nuclease
MNKYRFNIAWSEEDEGYIVTCPEFPGLSAFGETPEQALAEGQIALKLFIETYQEKEIPLPEPATTQSFSGQLRLRLPKSLHAQSVRMAAADGVSLNQFICDAVRAKFTAQEIGRCIVREVKKEFASQAKGKMLKLN